MSASVTGLSAEQRRALRSIAVPLNLVFWGLMLVLLDFNLASVGSTKAVSIDLLADWLGLVLIACGMAILAFGSVFEGLAELVVTLAAGVFIAQALFSVSTFFVPALGQLAPFTAVLLQLVGGAALAAFCGAMSSLAAGFGFPDLSRAWVLLAVGMVLLYTAPTLLVLIVPSLVPVAWALTLVLGLAVGVGLLSATRRTRRIAEEAVSPGRVRGGAV